MILNTPTCRSAVWNFDLTFKFEIKMRIEIVLANGSARVRPNRWMRGRPGPHTPSEVRELHATNTARPRRQKEVRVRTRPSRGVGGKEVNIPPPLPSEVMPRYNTSNRLHARLPFEKSWLNIKAYVLADQAPRLTDCNLARILQNISYV